MCSNTLDFALMMQECMPYLRDETESVPLRHDGWPYGFMVMNGLAGGMAIVVWSGSA